MSICFAASSAPSIARNGSLNESFVRSTSPCACRPYVISRRNSLASPPSLKYTGFGKQKEDLVKFFFVGERVKKWRFSCMQEQEQVFLVTAALDSTAIAEVVSSNVKTFDTKEDGRTELGQTGIIVPPVWQGTWQASGHSWGENIISDDQIIKALRTAQEYGMNAYDTAAGYGDGRSEELIARALKGVYREDYVVSTSVDCDDLKYRDIIRSCEQSLTNLNTDHIDLFYIHWPAGLFGTEEVPIADSLEALVDLKEKGHIRAIGVSNFDVQRLGLIDELLKLDFVELPHSLFWRSSETFLIPFCVERDIPILGYSPLGQGLLTGSFGPDYEFEPWADDVRKRNKLFTNPRVYDHAQDVLQKLELIAADLSMSMSGLALAWALNRPAKQQPARIIAGSANPLHVRENARTWENAAKLTPSHMALLEKLASSVTRYLDPEDECMWSFASERRRALQPRVFPSSSYPSPASSGLSSKFFLDL